MPERPKGPEWPYERAFDDGQVKALNATLTWLNGISKPISPDAAENTGG